MLSKLTMIGLHKYSDGHLWDNVVLPDGMDKDLFIGECLRQGGEFPVLYADLDFMKLQIGEFCKKWYHNFDRWWKAYQFEYEALFNLDVKSTRTEIGNNFGEAHSTSEVNSRSNNNSIGEDHSTGGDHSTGVVHSTGGSSDTSTQKKAAYDSDVFQNTQQTVNGGTNSVDTTNSVNSTNNADSTNRVDSLTTANSHNNVDSTNKANHDITIEEIRQGNQGVTMSQEMLLAEYNAWSYNIYNHMAEVFISEMCICIYL